MTVLYLSHKRGRFDEKTLQNVAFVSFLCCCHVVAKNIHLSKSGLAMAKTANKKKLALHL